MNSSLPSFNLFDPRFLLDPFPVYDEMRESAPVYWFEPARLWYATRYEDVASAFKNARCFSSQRALGIIGSQVPDREHDRFEPLLRALSNWMVFQDPPQHTRSRALVAKTFTARAVEQMRPRIQEIVEGLVDRARGAGRMEFVSEYADVVPIAVIAWMLGVPAEDSPKLREWTVDVAAFLGISSAPDAASRGISGAVAICDYFMALIAERRRSPREDMITEIVKASSEQGAKLHDQEIASACFLLLVAGHETTGTAIAWAAYMLLRHPEELEKLKADPSLLDGAVEEVLRYEPPVFTQGRVLTEDAELGGRHLEKGQMVLLSIAAANRDPSVFPSPHRFDITRRNNPHMSFGFGPHHCLGVGLARLELKVAVDTLFRRLPDLRLESDVPDFKPPSLMFHQLRTLPVRF